MFSILFLFSGCSCDNPVQPPVDKTVIKGTVTDSLTGQPLAGTVVRLNTGLSAVTDSIGRYRLIGMGGGTFTVSAKKIDWRLKSQSVTVVANDSQKADFVIKEKEWTMVSITNYYDIMDIFFVDENNGWICTYDAMNTLQKEILHTTDGGMNWSVQYRDTTPYSIPLDMKFIDINNGWVVGGGCVLRTTDGGNNWLDWYSQVDPPYGGLDEIFFTDPNNGWIIGDPVPIPSGDCIMHTTDGGDTWIRQTTGSNPDLFAINFINSNYGWVTGDDGVSNNIYKTVNGGSAWTLLKANVPVGEIQFFDALNGCGRGSSRFYKTSDGGVSWVEKTLPQLPMYMFFTEINLGWVSSINMLRTTDGGETWVIKNTPAPSDSQCWARIAAISPDYCWAVSRYSLIIYK